MGVKRKPEWQWANQQLVGNGNAAVFGTEITIMLS